MPELRISCRIACRADKQEARPPVVSRASDVEKYAIENHNFVNKCLNKRCKTCPELSTLSVAVSNVTKRTYPCVNHDSSSISCSSKNLIYLLTCIVCGQQYVGETSTRFNLRMNTHRTSKTGCEHVINHKKSCKGSSFSYQVLEKLLGTGHDKEGKIDSEATKARHTREDFWIKRLRTLFPYGLNEKAFDKVSDCGTNDTAVGRFFPSLPRLRLRPERSRRRVKAVVTHTVDSFFHNVNDWYRISRIDLYNNIRKLLNTLPRNLLKKIASEILDPDGYATDPDKEQIYLFILDIIDTKFISKLSPLSSSKISPKNICVIHFVNKGINLLRLSSIFKENSVVNHLPDILRTEENLPKVTTSLGPSIRNKILNYKEAVSSIHLKLVDNKYIVENLPECHCSLSNFSDNHHGHIVTGDLRVIENDKLRKLLSKGPNFREPTFLNFGKCLQSVHTGIIEFVEKTVTKLNLKKGSPDPWKNELLRIVRNKVSSLKNKVKPAVVKSTLKDPEVRKYLDDIHSKFVLVPIDKASNNIAIICKQFYITRLLQEVGLCNTTSNTYSLDSSSAVDVVNTNIDFCKSFNLEVPDRLKSLPFMYWTPKMHYSPSRARFIVASASCSTKPLSKAVSMIFKKIFKQIENFHRKSTFYKNYNRFWVIENSKPLLECLDKLNHGSGAKSISTFDFSTLYTKLPHDNLIEVLNGLIEFVFNGGRRTVDGSRKFLTVKGKTCFFSRTKQGMSYTKLEIKSKVIHLITNSYFTVGNFVFRQSIGIPMGIDPAPFWANLYLYHYESSFVTSLSKTDKYRGFKFKHCFRFIDDACSINDDNEFEGSYKDIYPDDLHLKCEFKGNHATFLELDIEIKNGKFVHKLFDKRDAFPFFIVRMPDLSGNIPEHVFYGSISAEFLRIARATLLYEDFVVKSKELTQRMLKQGAIHHKIRRCLGKAFNRHPNAFSSFNTNVISLKRDIVTST